jgi:hypothetical protein
MRRAPLIGLALLGLGAVASSSAGQTGGSVAPASASTCPDDHPVKGYPSRHSDGPGVYYAPGSAFYDRVKPERCFASEEAARQAGSRAGRQDRAPAQDAGRSPRSRP